MSRVFQYQAKTDPTLFEEPPVIQNEYSFKESSLNAVFTRTTLYQALAFCVPIFTGVADGIASSAGATVQFDRPVQYQAHTEPLVVTAEDVTLDKWLIQLSEPVRFKKQTYSEPFFFYPEPIAAEVVTVDKWFHPFVEVPKKLRFHPSEQQVLAFHPRPEVSIGWFSPLAELPKKPWLKTAQQQTLAFAPNPIVSFGWFNNLADPQKPKSVLRTNLQQSFTTDPYPIPPVEVIYESSWHQPWSDPVRIKRRVADPAPFTIGPRQPDGREGWYRPLNEPVRYRSLARAQYPYFTIDPYALTQPETVTESRWHQPWSEPVRFKKGLRSDLQQFYTAPVIFTVEVVTLDKWYQALSEPKRFKRGLPAYEQQWLALAQAAPFGETIFEDKWHQPWSLPRSLAKPGLAVYLQQTTAQDTDWIPNPRDYLEGWYNWLSTPVRKKPGLGVPLQQNLLWSSFTPPPPPSMSGWYRILEEPVRIKPGLRAPLQQYWTGPIRHLPTANVTVTMAATETNTDMADFAIRVYNPVDSIRVSVREISVGNDPVSIRESSPPGNDPVSIHESGGESDNTSVQEIGPGNDPTSIEET